MSSSPVMTEDPQQILARPLPVLANIEPNVAVSGVVWQDPQLAELHRIYTDIAQPLLLNFEHEVARPEWVFYSEKKDIAMSVRPPSPYGHNSLCTSIIHCPPVIGSQYVADWECRFQWDKFLGEVNILHHYVTNDKSKSLQYSIPYSPDYDCVLLRMTTNKKIWLKPRDSLLLQVSGPHPTRPKAMITICTSVVFEGCPPFSDIIRSSCPMLAWLFEPINDGQASKFTHICNFEFGRDTSSITEMLIIPFFPKMPVVNCFNKLIFIRSKLKEIAKKARISEIEGAKALLISSPSSPRVSSALTSGSPSSPPHSPSINSSSSQQIIIKSDNKKHVILTTNFSMHPNDWAQFVISHDKASKWKTVDAPIPSGAYLLYDEMKAINKTRGKGSKKLVIKAIFDVPHSPEHVNLMLMDKDLRWDPFIHTIKYADKGVIASGGGNTLSKKFKRSISSYRMQCLQYHGFIENKCYFLEERDNGDVILFTITKPGTIPNALTTSVEWYFFIFAENWADKCEQPPSTSSEFSISSFFTKPWGKSSHSNINSGAQEKDETTKIVDIFAKVVSDILPFFNSNELSIDPMNIDSDPDPQRSNKRELEEYTGGGVYEAAADYHALDSLAALNKRSKRSKEFHLNTPTDKFFDLPPENVVYLLPPFVPSKLLAYNTSSVTFVQRSDPATDLLSMPSEILNHIFSFFSDVDLCRCSRTCSNFKRLSERDSLWYCLYVKWFGKCCFKQSSLDSVLPPDITMWDNFRKTTFPPSALEPPFKDAAKTYFLSKETMYESIPGNWKKKFFLKIRMEALWALCRGDQPQNTGGDFGSGNEEGFTMMSICSYKISPSLYALVPNSKDEYISAILLHHAYAFFSTNTGDFYKVNLWSTMESYDQIFTKLNIDRNTKSKQQQIQNQMQIDNNSSTITNNNTTESNQNVNTISLWLNQQNVLHSLQSNKVLLQYNLETKQQKETVVLENKRIPSTWDISGATQSYFGDRVAVHYNNHADSSANDDYDTLLDVFDVESGSLLTTIDKQEQITCASFNRSRIAIGGQRGPVDLFDCNTGRPVISFLGHNKSVLSCRLLDDEDCVVSSSDDNTVKFYDERAGPYYLKRLQSQWPVKTFDLTPNRLICATSTKISYWDPRNLQSPIGELWSPLTTDVVNIQLSQFNVMVQYSNGISHVWDFR